MIGCMILVDVMLVVWGTLLVRSAIHAKWIELVNPPLKYKNSDDEMNFSKLNMQKTRNIITVM